MKTYDLTKYTAALKAGIKNWEVIKPGDYPDTLEGVEELIVEAGKEINK